MSGFLRFGGRQPGSSFPGVVDSKVTIFPRPQSDGAGDQKPDRSLSERLGQLYKDESIEQLTARLGEFRRSIERTLEKSSQAYQILSQLEQTNLKDCARCTKELQSRLAGNPHFVVLGKIIEAEQALAALDPARQ